MKNINTSKWAEFKLSELGFLCHHGKRLSNKERIEGNICFITAGKEKQGIGGYIGNNVDTFEKSITVDMFGNCFYHQEACGGDDNVYFFVNDKLPESIKLFLASSINSDLKDKYSYAHQFRQKDADSLKVKLPAMNKYTPDWHRLNELTNCKFGGGYMI